MLGIASQKLQLSSAVQCCSMLFEVGLALLSKEFNTVSTPHVSREVEERAGDVYQAMGDCWLLQPLSHVCLLPCLLSEASKTCFYLAINSHVSCR